MPVGSHGSEKFITPKLEQGFEELFTDVVVQNHAGIWAVRSTGLNKHPELNREDMKRLTDGLNHLERRDLEPRSRIQRGQTTFGAKEYVKCTLKGIVPGAVLTQLDYGKLYSWIKQKSWGKIAPYIAKHAAKVGVRDLAKFTPAGFAGAVAISMIQCAIWR